MPNESNGSLKKHSDWDWLSNNSIAIGQEMSATTMQIAMAYSVIANGGYLIKPTILSLDLIVYTPWNIKNIIVECIIQTILVFDH